MPEQKHLRGIVLLLLAIVCFASLDVIVKYLSTHVPLLVMVWFRYAIHCLLMIVLLGPTMGRSLLRTKRPWALTMRGLTLIATTVLGMAAFRAMPLAETTAIIFLSPLIVSIAAGPLLGERIGVERWIAVAAGFSGVLLIARPGSGITTAGVLFGLGTAACYSIYQLHTRMLADSENTYALVFFTALTGTAVVSAGMPFYWHPFSVDGFDSALLIAMGMLGGGGHLLLTRAFRHAPASTLAPFLYVQLAWATFFGWLFFDHLPDAFAIAGMVVIASSSGGLALLERRRAASVG
ncbi:MAG: DMT family transporter [Rhodocyclaceae bacterium]|jgi:drug/metabolite transporter (DMT)-like permease|nr:DMT family transporter [Rhodocyclaceae bacterium]